MLNQLFAKVLDQSLDELLKKNVCLSVPLSPNKIENTIKSLYGENRYVVDLSNNVKLSDFAAAITNLKSDSVVLIKNINYADDEYVETLTHLLSKRQIPLVIDQNGEDKVFHIDIADCYFIALMTENELINYPLSEYFNIKMQLSSADLPEPMEVKLENSNTDSDSSLDETDDNEDDNSNYSTIVWHIDNALFEFEDKSDLKKWKKAGKALQFEFDPSNSDDGGNSIFADIDSATKFFDLNDDNSTLNISEEGNQISVSAWVRFSVELNSDISEDEFNEWAYENGGVSCGTINLKDIDATIISDDGQELRLNTEE